MMNLPLHRRNNKLKFDKGANHAVAYEDDIQINDLHASPPRGHNLFGGLGNDDTTSSRFRTTSPTSPTSKTSSNTTRPNKKIQRRRMEKVYFASRRHQNRLLFLCLMIAVGLILYWCQKTSIETTKGGRSSIISSSNTTRTITSNNSTTAYFYSSTSNNHLNSCKPSHEGRSFNIYSFSCLCISETFYHSFSRFFLTNLH